jgi:hypothetical protein
MPIPVSTSETLRFGQKLVANQPIGPEIGHLDFQKVFARLCHAGKIHSERRLPKDSQTLAVKTHFSEILLFSARKNAVQTIRDNIAFLVVKDVFPWPAG